MLIYSIRILSKDHNTIHTPTTNNFFPSKKIRSNVFVKRFTYFGTIYLLSVINKKSQTGIIHRTDTES